MAKMEGPEEFFEALRAAKRDKLATPPVEKPQEGAAPPAGEEPSAPAESPPVRPAPKATGRRLPFSIFTEDEPTIAVRRSTIVFAIAVVLVLLFIAYAIGKSSAASGRPQPADQPEHLDSGALQTKELALPPELRGRFIIYAKDLDHTLPDMAANAGAYEEFLNTSPATQFLRHYGKKAYILSSGQRLLVCVGPFDGENDEIARTVRSQLQEVSYQGVAHFRRADLLKVPEQAQLYVKKGDTR